MNAPQPDWAAALQRAATQWPAPERRGRVVRALGSVIQVTGLQARVGDMCQFSHPGAEAGTAAPWQLQGEVIGLEGEHLLVLPLGELDGVSNRTQVAPLGHGAQVQVGPGLLGQVLDGFGRPLTPGARLDDAQPCPIKASPPDALCRRAVTQPLATGVRAIDALLTCGVGQRLGIFAPAGTGKSTLLSMIAQGSACDVVVLALVGERGREVGEFLEEIRHLGLGPRSIVVVATSDRSSAERAKAPEVAMACAEYFRAQGQSVLLLMDSVTRYARALREIGLAAGEPPTRRGYPPSVFNALPRLFERAGWSDRGAITAFFTVLVDDDSAGDPIFEEARATLDGHILLSPRLADSGHYPAIDVLASRSRVMQRVVPEAHAQAARTLRELLQKLQDIETLVQIGEYRSGSDAVADRALAARDEINTFLRQALQDPTPAPQTLDRLQALLRIAPPRPPSSGAPTH
ncbi:FliI/YscN family ATPase [Aquabacterium sp. OR-4]|uniref:FliI/YscN family ATPase n=1 Tax=Aquabacterium sp. OR-4 TaxID=2978127 RepID=UPI0021B3623E|nr:FliI/YscN family ATPase [Aquabacterium sp. OR-4]MDT7836050.1 FliI/YscN family ATPase [Aquabacterium sp. OR-4]